jgi:tight adherence protein C
VKRTEAFISQLPELTRVLANATQAGLAMRTALAMAAEELDNPAGEELRRVADQLAVGHSLDDALGELAERLPSRELVVLVTTLVLSSRAGGQVVSSLRNLTETLEERKETRREVTTMLSQVKVTALAVPLLGLGFLLMINGMAPGRAGQDDRFGARPDRGRRGLRHVRRRLLPDPRMSRDPGLRGEGKRHGGSAARDPPGTRRLRCVPRRTLIRADAELPGDLAVALEVGATGYHRRGIRHRPARHAVRPVRPAHDGTQAGRRTAPPLDMAGNPGGMTVDRYAARRAVYGILGVLAALSLVMRGQPVIGILAVRVRHGVDGRHHPQAIRKRRDDIERTLPDFLDVLAVVVSAGLGFRQALERVADKYQGPWSDELHITLRQMDMGSAGARRSTNCASATPPTRCRCSSRRSSRARNWARPIVDTLIQIANDMRRTDAQNARRSAAKTIPKATLVTLVFMLPATMILIATGMFLGSGTNFGSILGR